MSRLLAYGRVLRDDDRDRPLGCEEILGTRVVQWWRRISGSPFALRHHVLGGAGCMDAVHASSIETAVAAGVDQLRRCIKCGNYMVPEEAVKDCANRWLWYPEPRGGWTA